MERQVMSANDRSLLLRFSHKGSARRIPICFAVSKLVTSSNSVGCSTGSTAHLVLEAIYHKHGSRESIICRRRGTAFVEGEKPKFDVGLNCTTPSARCLLAHASRPFLILSWRGKS